MSANAMYLRTLLTGSLEQVYLGVNMVQAINEKLIGQVKYKEKDLLG